MNCFEPYAVCLKVANGPLFEFTAELCFWLPVSASMVPQAAKAGCVDHHLRFLLHRMAPSIDNGTGIDPLTVQHGKEGHYGLTCMRSVPAASER